MSNFKNNVTWMMVMLPIGLLFSVIPAFLLYMAYDGARTITFGKLWGKDYERVTCRVVSAKEIREPSIHSMEVKFMYIVPGDERRIGDKSGVNRDATSWAWDVRPGDTGECYYNRNQPDDAFIMDGTRQRSWIAVLIGPPIACGLIALFWFAIRKRSQGVSP